MRVLPGWMQPALIDVSSIASARLVRMCVLGVATTGAGKPIAWLAQFFRLRRLTRMPKSGRR